MTTELPEDLLASLEVAEFCCPECGGDRFGTDLRDPNNPVGRCQSGRCAYRWHRTADAKHFRPSRFVLEEKLKDCFDLLIILRDTDPDDSERITTLRARARLLTAPAPTERTVTGTVG